MRTLQKATLYKEILAASIILFFFFVLFGLVGNHDDMLRTTKSVTYPEEWGEYFLLS
jgi:hypothetical protein